jgi:hypothetical protein
MSQAISAAEALLVGYNLWMKLARSLTVGIVVASCLFAFAGCGNGSDGSKVNGAGANGSGPNGSAGSELNLTGGSLSSAGTGAGIGSGTGSSEICDGIDNDNDGIIDNVDKNGDGVCDCLLIATLGVKGTSGQGDVFAAWLSARSNTGAADLADQVLTPELLAKYEVIVAQNVNDNHQYSDAEVSALADWVNKGGGFMTLIGYSSAGEAHNVNRLLAPFTMSYTDQQILRKQGTSTIPITMWTPHPIDTGVAAVGVDNGYPVQGMGTTIATGGGFDVAKVQEVGKGHVFLWGDEWITYNSEWQNHPDYQVQLLWLNSIKWLTVAGQCQVVIPPNPPK